MYIYILQIVRLKHENITKFLLHINTLMNTKESATANAAPMRKNPRGTGSSVRSPKPWAYAGQATKLPAAAAAGSKVFNINMLATHPKFAINRFSQGRGGI